MSRFIATASAAYWRQALSELRSVDPKIGSFRQLAPGVVRFQSTLGREEFLSRLAENEIIFLRHLQPVDLEVALAGAAEGDLPAVTAAIGPVLASIRPGERIAVQVRRLSGDFPYGRLALKEAIDPLITAAGGYPVTTGADRILSIAQEEGLAQIGIATPAEQLSDWPGGEVRFRREEEQISRAKFKLLEALATFEVRFPDGGQALDLGAAPGGWTSLLLERGLRVTAVDTGEMAEVLKGNPRLTILRKNVEEVAFEPDRFDLITCDMSWNPLHTADLLVKQAPAVKEGAHGILTVKLMLENPTRTIRRVRELLEGHYRVLRVKQLFHNRDEVTIHLIRRA
ncbi:MAG: SAM-dependent methyltransferase [Bacillota bacterium]